MHRVRPEQAIAADAWRRAVTGLGHCGVTQTSRSKVEVVPEGGDPLGRLMAPQEDALARFRREHPRRRSRVLVSNRADDGRWQVGDEEVRGLVPLEAL